MEGKSINPIKVTLKGNKSINHYTTGNRPGHCDYPIKGLPWQVADHPDCLFTTQQLTFLNNHLQLIEMSVVNEVTLELNIEKASVFMVIMLEGFYRYYHHDLLNFYAMGGAMYMLYCPISSLELRVDGGKHSLIVIDIAKKQLGDIENTNTQLTELVKYQFENQPDHFVLPMCRIDRQVFTLLAKLRTLKVDSFIREAEYAILLANLLKEYSIKLTNNNIIRSQLAPEIANKIFVYIQQNYYQDNELSLTEISAKMGLNKWKLQEYALLLFGKPLRDHIRDLRMRKVMVLLEETDKPIRTIAESVGYTTPSYFYRAFRLYFGLTPQQYRKINRKKTDDQE